MPVFYNRILDEGLGTITSSADRIYICTSEPINTSQVASSSIGYVDLDSLDPPEARTPDGRKVVIPEITDGTMTANGNPTHYAVVIMDGSSIDELLATGNEITSVVGSDDNAWSSPTFDIGIPAPASGRFLHDSILDSGLAELSDVTHLYIVGSLITSYGSLSGNILGTKATPSIGAVGNGTPSGRKRTVAAITDGTGNANGTGSHWVLSNNTGSVILAAGPLASSKAINSGEDWELTEFDITIPQPS
jgi:hypothetical protein